MLSSALAVATLFSVVQPAIGASLAAPADVYTASPLSAPAFIPMQRSAPLKAVVETQTAAPRDSAAQPSVVDHPVNVSKKAPFRLLPAISASAPLSTTCSTIQIPGGNQTLGQPAISGNGQQVGFWSIGSIATNGTGINPDGNVEVYVADTTNGIGNVQVTQVTSSTGSILGGFNLFPSLSGDGMRVAFASDRNFTGGNADGNFEIFVADASASGVPTVTQVTTTSVGVNTTPALSADGNHVAFASNNELIPTGNPDNSTEIYVATLSGTGVLSYTQLTHSGIDIVNDEPAINQDGTAIAYIARTVETATVFLMNTTLITPTAIGTSSLAVDNHPSISQDGDSVVFVSDYDLDHGKNLSGAAQVFLYVAGLGLTQVTTNGANNNLCAYPSISGNGLRVACVNQNNKILLYNIRTGSNQQLSYAGAKYSDPHINTDGQNISYIQDGNLYVTNCPVADLAISKSVDPGTSTETGRVAYTLIVTNNGPGVANNVTVSDALPLGIALPSQLVPNQTDQFKGDFDAGLYYQTEFSTGLRLKDNQNYWELPNNGAHTWTDMFSTTVLLHLNRLTGTSATDDSGNNSISVKCVTGVGCPTIVPGKLISGAEFATGNQGLEITDSQKLNFGNGQDFTIILWVRPTPNQPSNSYGHSSILEKFMGNQPGNTGYPFAIQIYNQGNTTYNGKIWAGRNDGLFSPAIFSTSRVDDGKYHQIVFKRDRAPGNPAYSAIYLYVDGQLQGYQYDYTGFYPLSFCQAYYNIPCDTQNPSDIHIGHSSSIVNQNINTSYMGDIDEVAILSRALAEPQIIDIYNKQSAVLRYSGYFTSRIIDAGRAVDWNRLTWTLANPTRAASGPLPDNGGSDAGYPLPGTTSMSGNILLMHFDEPVNSTSWVDSSPKHIANIFSSINRAPIMGGTGIFNGSASYSQPNSYIEIPDGGALNVVDSVSVEAWINPTNSSPYQMIMGKWTLCCVAPAPAGYMLAIKSGQLLGQVADTNNQTFSLQGGAISNNSWTHVAMTWKSGGNQVLYINGTPVMTRTASPLPVQSTSVDGFIGLEAYQGNTFTGSMDEVAVFQRELSGGEIQEHYLRAPANASSVKFQVRTCPASCSTEPFIGPNGLSSSYFVITPGLIATGFTATLGVAPNQFFQYQANFNTDDYTIESQKVVTVDIGPSHGAANTSQGDCNTVNPVVCTLGVLSAGATATVTIGAEVGAGVAGDVANQANTYSDADDINPTNNVATATVYITSNVRLSFAKLVTPQVVSNLQQPITFTLVVTNDGTSTANSVTFSDTLPADFTLQRTDTSNAPGAICNQIDGGVVLFCTMQTLSGKTKAAIQFSGQVFANLTGQISNTATVSTTEFQTPLSSTVTVKVPLNVDMSIGQATLPTTATAGSRLIYTITATNLNNNNANTVIVTDTLDSNAAYLSATSTANCANNAGVVQCNLGVVNAANVFTIAVRVDPTATVSSLTNVISVTTSDLDFNQSNDHSSLSTQVDKFSHLRISKAALASVNAGDPLVYTLVFTNDGPSTASSVVITDALPDGLLYDQTGPLPLGFHQDAGIQPLKWRVGRMGAGASGTIQFTATTPVTTPPPSFTNFVTITSLTVDPTPGGNTDVASTDIVPVGPGAVSFIRPTTCVVNSGCILTATVTQQNATVPITFTFTADGQTPVTVTVTSITATATFTWTTGGTKNINIRAVNQGGQAINNDQVLIPEADMSISIIPIPVINVGETVTYTLVFTNNGPTSASEVYVTATLTPSNLPAYAIGGSVSAPGGFTVVSQTSTLIAYSTPFLTEGQYQVVFTATAPLINPPGSLGVTASVEASTTDLTQTNNTASLVTVLLAQANLAISIKPQAAINAGDNITYTLVFTNYGPTMAGNVFITSTLKPPNPGYTIGSVISPLPAGFNQVQAGVYSNTIVFSATSASQMALGQPYQIMFTATSPIMLPPSALSATAVITSSTPETPTALADNSYTDTLGVTTVPITGVVLSGPVPNPCFSGGCAFTASVSPINATQPVTYSWVATNPTGGTPSGINLNSHTNTSTANVQWNGAGVPKTESITVTVSDMFSHMFTQTITVTVN